MKSDGAPLSDRLFEDVGVALATLDGKAYYYFTEILKSIGIKFLQFSPGERIPKGVGVVLTTAREKDLIDHPMVLSLEDLGVDPAVVKEKLLSHLLGDQAELLVVGIDPGERIGLAVYCMNREVDCAVLNSVDGTVTRVLRWLHHSRCKNGVVRIGRGNMHLAEGIALSLSKSLPKNVKIELVDERGTSSLCMAKPNRRGTRDQMSARLIALRQGRAYRPENKS